MAITFETIESVNNGARFYATDLHVHSYGASADVSDPGMTVESIIDEAVGHGVALLAIADHNTDKHVDPALEYATKYSGRLLVLPAVEVTTANGHLLVYFAPEKSEKVRDLLSRIAIVGQFGARDSHTTKSMADVIGEAERLGGVCVAGHVDRADNTGFEMIVDGYPNWKKDIIASSGLYGLEVDDSSHLGWYSAEDEPTPKGAERKKLLDARGQIPAISARVRLAPLQNSDGHRLSDFRAYLAGRAGTRLKMKELSFDGFRTALIDPEARVRAVATLPRSVPRVLGMHVSGGFLEAGSIRFSDNLNCFIGGRGTGKSTALRSLAYGLGCRDEFGELENCPDAVVVYGEDGNGVIYRYERHRGQPPLVQAKEDRSIKDVPADAFRVEFYGQGELAEVAKDPLTNAALLQEFLDRHIRLRDLAEREDELLRELMQNSAQLIPLEASAALLGGKRAAVDQVDTKLKIAETGKVKEIASFQTTLAAEKSLADSLTEIEKFYRNGMTLASFLRDYDGLLQAAGTLTGRADCAALLERAKAVIGEANAFLRTQEQGTNARLKTFSESLGQTIRDLRGIHKLLDEELAAKIGELQKQGLSGSVKELNDLVQQRSKVAGEIARIKSQEPQLNQLRTRRTELLVSLAAVRGEMMERRKGQLKTINQNLRETIDDYGVYIYYDAAGVLDEFYSLIDSVMHGSYFPAESAKALCSRIDPQALMGMVAAGDTAGITKASGITQNWAQEVVKRFGILTELHKLQVTAKPGKPVIKVTTKGPNPKELSINQLSDGQKHTILLTIAMLAESNVPLIIDQPEDDLDNAFIFKSVVATLRSIKERRQVILVTHNANIAVLGDSELLLPMQRISGAGAVVHRGSVDGRETRKAVQDILEGGELAFRRRKEIYGY